MPIDSNTNETHLFPPPRRRLPNRSRFISIAAERPYYALLKARRPVSFAAVDWKRDRVRVDGADDLDVSPMTTPDPRFASIASNEPSYYELLDREEKAKEAARLIIAGCGLLGRRGYRIQWRDGRFYDNGMGSGASRSRRICRDHQLLLDELAFQRQNDPNRYRGDNDGINGLLPPPVLLTPLPRKRRKSALTITSSSAAAEVVAPRSSYAQDRVGDIVSGHGSKTKTRRTARSLLSYLPPFMRRRPQSTGLNGNIESEKSQAENTKKVRSGFRFRKGRILRRAGSLDADGRAKKTDYEGGQGMADFTALTLSETHGRTYKNMGMDGGTSSTDDDDKGGGKGEDLWLDKLDKPKEERQDHQHQHMEQEELISLVFDAPPWFQDIDGTNNRDKGKEVDFASYTPSSETSWSSSGAPTYHVESRKEGWKDKGDPQSSKDAPSTPDEVDACSLDQRDRPDQRDPQGQPDSQDQRNQHVQHIEQAKHTEQAQNISFALDGIKNEILPATSDARSKGPEKKVSTKTLSLLLRNKNKAAADETSTPTQRVQQKEGSGFRRVVDIFRKRQKNKKEV